MKLLGLVSVLAMGCTSSLSVNPTRMSNGENGYWIISGSHVESSMEAGSICGGGFRVQEEYNTEEEDRRRNALVALSVGMGAFGQSMQQQHGNPNAENTAAKMARFYTKTTNHMLISCVALAPAHYNPLVQTTSLDCTAEVHKVEVCKTSPTCSIDELDDLIKKKFDCLYGDSLHTP